MLRGDTSQGALLCPLRTRQESKAPLGTGHGRFIDVQSRLGPSVPHPGGMTGEPRALRSRLVAPPLPEGDARSPGALRSGAERGSGSGTGSPDR